MAKGLKPGVRLSRAVRTQLEWQTVCLDDLIAQDHRARAVWAYVESLDLSPLYERVEAVAGEAGRPAIDPAILMALWLYATLEGIGSARLLDRLCESDHAYRWIRGGVGVNYHTLADFRVETGPFLDDLLSRSVAALVAAEVVDLSCVAVDGVRVRAAAGSGSFRAKERLAELDRLAREKVATLRSEVENDPAAATNRLQARRASAAEDRLRRLQAAREAHALIEAQRMAEAESQRRRTPKKGKTVRASTTDPQARIMKMADGGFRPAYNLQVKTDVAGGFVVGVAASDRASDRGQLTPAMAEIKKRYGATPQRVLADGGYDGKDDVERLHQEEIALFCPVSDAHKKSDGPGMRALRERMAREDGQAQYRKRFATERPHADMRNRGLQRFLVRGKDKVKAVVLWFVHAHNFLRLQSLQAASTA
jgi:transposase